VARERSMADGNEKDPRLVVALDALEDVAQWLSQKEPRRWPEFTVRDRVRAALEFAKRD
jgi:hypothetical protein